MQALAPTYITEDEYWKMEQAALTKHEYFNGQIYAMAGASPVHNIIAMNAGASLTSQLKGKKCRAVGSDQLVKVEETGLQTYPDIVVYCPPARFDAKRPDTLLEPAVLIEVLSPSTADYDRTDKFDHYKKIATLGDYLLIAQDKRRVEHFHRDENNQWILQTATQNNEAISLQNIGCELKIEDVYDGTDLPPALDLLRAPIEDALTQDAS